VDPIDELRGAFAGEVSVGAERRASAGRDASDLVGAPQAVVRPRDLGDVVALVRWARRSRVPLVARGGGTSLDGEAVPVEGGVVVDFAAWTTVREIDAESRNVRVGPGVVNRELDLALAPHAVFFPPNPGSWTTSTLGGNAATNASGPRSFRYGATRAWVLGFEAVLGSGETVQWGNRSSKRSTGPSLVDLLIGSEGTLGLFTDLTLRLAARPPRRFGLVVPLKPGASPGKLARALAGSADLGLSAIEFLDASVAQALGTVEGSKLPTAGPLILLEVESSDALADARLERVDAALNATGQCEEAVVYPDADRLWTLRGQSGPVLERTLGARIREDVGVPLARLDELLASIYRLAEKYGVPVAVFGHLGEGNLHPTFALEGRTAEAERLRGELLETAHAHGGTISAEHGIGRLKRAWMAREVGETGLATLRALKTIFDPDGILNPGKILP
jgi:D-lactate dehydrogenase